MNGVVTLKLNIQKVFRVAAPLFLAFVIIVTAALPAYAFSMSVPSGTYAFLEQIDAPTLSFLVNMPFTCDGVSYTGLIYRTPDDEAAFRYGAVYYIRADNGQEERACYWINDDTYWIGYAYRVLILEQPYTVTNSNFYAWFIVNAGVVTDPDAVNPWGDITQDQLDDLEDRVDQNQSDIEDLEDAYGQIPLPNINPDDYNISIWLETEFTTLTSCLGVVWESPLIMNIIACLGAFLLFSFLVFGGK